MGGSLSRAGFPEFFKVNGAWGFAQTTKQLLNFGYLFVQGFEIFGNYRSWKWEIFFSLQQFMKLETFCTLEKMLEDRNLSKYLS